VKRRPDLRRGLARLALLLLATAGPAAPAQEFRPYPSPKITVDQWKGYLEIVTANFESTAQIYKDENVVVFSDRRTRTFYIFTTKDHPAHPAWITRQMVEENGQVSVRQIGYFAGSEEHFAQLFREYQAKNEKLREDVERRNR
jgi:hypothetical protein